MKYTIDGFNQQKLVEYGLDNTDALILRWYVDFLPKMATISQDGKLYQWVKYQAIIDDLPCIGITNKQVISRRFTKFVDCGIMEKYVHKDSGVFTCFSLTKKYLTLVGKTDDSLPEVDPSTKKLIPLSTQKLIGVDSKVDTPINSKVDTKDSSININSSIISNKENFLLFNEQEFTNKEVDIINLWLEYKKERNESYKPVGLKGLKTQLLNFKNENHSIEDIIITSISGNYMGLFAPKTPPKPNYSQLQDTPEPKREMRYCRIDSQYQVAIDGSWGPVSMGEFTEEKAQELLTKYNAIFVESKF